MSQRRSFRWATPVLLWLAGCAPAPGPGPQAVRLVDLYTPAAVENRVTATAPPPPTEWRFDGPAPDDVVAPLKATRGWEALSGVTGLAIRNGRLVGRTTSELPVLHFERTTGLDEPDLVHELQVRLRVSGGSNLSASFSGAVKLDRDQALDYARNFPWDFTTPLAASDEPRTCTLKSTLHVLTSRTRHIALRPTDQAGATFEIESVRIVSRREHLASVASGVGWQGLSEVYRETIVARSPERINLVATLPARPELDLGVGTVEDAPVTFHVGVRLPGARDETPLLERTVTRPHRWEDAPVDLQAFAGRQVTLSLSVSGEKPGMLGFWGSPTIRSLGAAARPATASAPPDPPQGVILIWADTLRRDHLGAYGYERPTTPVLDRMVAEGTLFRDCVGQATWTKVATPSLLTSLYPASHGVHDFFDRLPASATTLAEVYREAGYATISFSSILFTGKFTNLHQGFEVVNESGSLPEPDSSKTARDYVDRLLPWLEAHRDVPFLVFLHVSDPHDPYRPRPPYDTLWADAAQNERHEKDDKALRKVIADPLLRHMGAAMPTREELQKARLDPEAYVGHDRDWYDGSIRGMDAEIGRLLERLRAPGLAGRTLVVFTGDHGEEFLEHGRTFHGQSVYGELSNLPLVFWRPGFVPAGVVEETVQTIDVMPTLLEMSGLRVPPQAQGRSLARLLAGSRAARGTVHAAGADRPAISEKNEIPGALSGGSPPPRDTESFAIVLGGWKLIHNTKRAAGKPEFELFDHRNDALDASDLAPQHPDVVERLARELEAWHRAAAAARLKPEAEADKDLRPEELERLRALGYVQ